MIAKLENYLLSKYLPLESEEYFQARVLLMLHIALATVMLIVLLVTPATGTILRLLEGIFLLSACSILIIRFGFLPAATLISYSGMGLLATLAVFAKPYYQNFETYTLATFHMFITIVASLLTRQRFYTFFTTISGVFYIILLFFIRGLRMSSPDSPLEIDDYILSIAFLIMTGFILRNTLDRRNKLLEIAETESRLHHETAIQLRHSLDEKTILIQEVHHRVKNNLNVAISLLNMQIRKLDNSDKTVEILQDSIGRLHSMALVHERLYGSDNLRAIELKPYIISILQAVMSSLQRTNIHFKLDVDNDITIELAKAVPCGLIINELITNVYKHAFTGIESGQAEISFSRSHDNLVKLMVKDEGVGIPQHDWTDGASLGMHLVTLLTEQLQGKLEIDGRSGTEITITFPLSTPETNHSPKF